MPAPFFKLISCTSWGPGSLKVIIAASGPVILCFHAADGLLISEWTHGSSETTAEDVKDEQDDEPPAKRRRLSNAAEDDEVSDAPSAEVITNNEAAQKPRRKKPRPAPQPSVIKLCVTRDGKHVVAVTAEDKTIRVFEMVDGRLNQISERQMPKKPSAITLTADQASILAADKFGDVYALPLLVNKDYTPAPPTNATEQAKSFKPSATNLTVHTKKNLRALEHQTKNKQQAAQKKTLDFEHKLLLGHVSLLTDVLAVTRDIDGNKRNYILTADRDEHIRVNRGIPQTHVIEGFCLGHTSFVNKLLIHESRPEVLISGGGDDFLIAWDWINGREMARASLTEYVNPIRLALLSVEDGPSKPSDNNLGDSKVAVQGLWAVKPRSETSSTDIIVSCEAVPALFFFRLEANSLRHHQIIELDGNPLDVAVDAAQQAILVSVDNVHKPGSASEVTRTPRPFVHEYVNSEGVWEPALALKGLDEKLNNLAGQWFSNEGDIEASILSGLFYGAEHLRKKMSPEGEGDVDLEDDA